SEVPPLNEAELQAKQKLNEENGAAAQKFKQKEVTIVNLPDVAAAMRDVLASLQRNEPEKASARLDNLDKDLAPVTNQVDRQKLHQDLTKEIQSLRGKLKEPATDLSRAAGVLTKLRALLNGQSTFDLNWLQAAMAVDKRDYSGFVAAFTDLRSFLPQQGEEGFSSADSLIKRVTEKSTDDADIEKLIEALPGGCPEPRLQKMLSDLLISEVDGLVKNRYAGLRT